MAKETAEQKLLKLIETTDAQSGQPRASQQAAPSSEAEKVLKSVRGADLSAVSIPPFLIQLFISLKGLFSEGQSTPFGLKSVNRILVLGVAVVAIFFVWDFIQQLNSSKKEIDFALLKNTASLVDVSENQDASLPKFETISDYLKLISQRNIFQPFERKVVETVGEVNEEISGIRRVDEQTKDLKLVGISWFEDAATASAMIEDTNSGETFFKARGEQIYGVTIKNIFAESIVVTYQGEDMEIKL